MMRTKLCWGLQEIDVLCRITFDQQHVRPRAFFEDAELRFLVGIPSAADGKQRAIARSGDLQDFDVAVDLRESGQHQVFFVSPGGVKEQIRPKGHIDVILLRAQRRTLCHAPIIAFVFSNFFRRQFLVARLERLDA
jgi:hypothetical protein